MTFLTFYSNAQKTQNPCYSYKECKLIYNYKNYDPSYEYTHDPSLLGVASFFIPGLGQYLAGENGLGTTHLTIHVLSSVLTITGLIKNQTDDDLSSSIALFTVGFLGNITNTVFAISNAVRVAKVMNMAYKDRENKRTSSIMLLPTMIRNPINNKNSFGLSLNISLGRK